MRWSPFEISLADSERAGGLSLRIVIAAVRARILASLPTKPGDSVNSRLGIFRGQSFRVQVANPGLRLGGDYGGLLQI